MVVRSDGVLRNERSVEGFEFERASQPRILNKKVTSENSNELSI